MNGNIKINKFNKNQKLSVIISISKQFKIRIKLAKACFMFGCFILGCCGDFKITEEEKLE